MTTRTAPPTRRSTSATGVSQSWPACRYELAIAVERQKPLIAVVISGDARPPKALALLPPDVELIDAGGSVSRAITLVGARLAARDPVS